MPNHEKYEVGERVEMWCPHLRAGRPVTDWVAGKVTQADYRMVAVKFETEVFTGNGWPVPERVLWCTHGSRHLRRPAEEVEK